MTEKAKDTDLQDRIDELEEQVTKLKAEAKDRRLRGTKLQEQLDAAAEERDAAVKERDALKTKADAGPKQYTDRIAELEAKLASHDHRDAFRGVADFTVKSKDKDGKDVETKYSLNDGVAIEDVWSKAEYKPAGDVPDEAKVRGVLEGAFAKAKYLFKTTPADKGETPKTEAGASTTAIRTQSVTPGPGASRSVSTSSGSTERPTVANAVMADYAKTGRKVPGRL